MRLSAAEVQSIRQELHSLDPDGVIYLFGSRLDDTKIGGDVDLFFQSAKVLSFREKLHAQARLIDLLDRKVDLIVKIPGDQELTIHEIAREGITL